MAEAPRSKRNLLMSKLSKARRSSQEPDSSQDNVAEFLEGARQPSRPPQAPRLDVSVAQRWPGAASLPQAGPEQPNVTASRPLRKPVRRPRRSGLSVHFSQEEPVVIGCGGDGTTTPSIYISQAKARALRSNSDLTSLQRPECSPARGRARTSPESNQAHANLVSAGVFGDRPPSRDNRANDSQERNDSASHAYTSSEDRPSSALHSAETVHNGRSMNEEEGRVFSLAHRASKEIPAPPATTAAAVDMGSKENLSQSDTLRPQNEPLTWGHLPSPSPSLSTGQPKLHSGPVSPGRHGLPITPPSDNDSTRARKPPGDYFSMAPCIASAVGSSTSLPGVLVNGTTPESLRVDVGGIVGQRSRANTQTSMEPDSGISSELSLHSTESLSVHGFNDFASRVNQMRGVFRLTAEKERSGPVATDEWLRCAFWWFRLAKIGLSDLPNSPHRGLLMQAHVDLAKAWWILVEGLDQEATKEDLRKNEDALCLRSHLESITLWMAKYSIMPPEASLIQGQDTTMWITHPPMLPSLQQVLTSASPLVSLKDSMPLGDTRHYFLYQNIFATVGIDSDAASAMPCAISLIRHRAQHRISMVVSTQSPLVNILVSPTGSQSQENPSWYDIMWHAKSSFMSINLKDLTLRLSLAERDYRSLSSIFEFTRAVDKSFEPSPGETLVYSSALQGAQYSGKQQSFPPQIVKSAFIGVYETSQQQAKRGFRLMLSTPTTSKTLGTVSVPFDAKNPFLFEVAEGAAPVLAIRSSDNVTPWKILLAFGSSQAMKGILDIMRGMQRSQNEEIKAKLPLKCFSAQPIDGSANGQHLKTLEQLRWLEAMVIDRRSAPLGITLSHTKGSLADPLNVAPGAQLLRLPASTEPSITLARQAQPDFLSAMDSRATAPPLVGSLTSATRSISELATLRTYAFHNLADLHVFQCALTGYTVACDIVPSRFAITRHRSGISLHKKAEATSARVQILTRDDGYTQIAVFFEGFALADAMIFPVKAGDAFERKGAGVKLVDAHFTLKDADAGVDAATGLPIAVRRRFVSIEGDKRAEEANDILVTFASDTDTDAFCEALPGAVQAGSRSFLKRR